MHHKNSLAPSFSTPNKNKQLKLFQKSVKSKWRLDKHGKAVRTTGSSDPITPRSSTGSPSSSRVDLNNNQMQTPLVRKRRNLDRIAAQTSTLRVEKPISWVFKTSSYQVAPLVSQISDLDELPDLASGEPCERVVQAEQPKYSDDDDDNTPVLSPEPSPDGIRSVESFIDSNNNKYVLRSDLDGNNSGHDLSADLSQYEEPLCAWQVEPFIDGDDELCVPKTEPHRDCDDGDQALGAEPSTHDRSLTDRTFTGSDEQFIKEEPSSYSDCLMSIDDIFAESSVEQYSELGSASNELENPLNSPDETFIDVVSLSADPLLPRWSHDISDDLVVTSHDDISGRQTTTDPHELLDHVIAEFDPWHSSSDLMSTGMSLLRGHSNVFCV